MIPTISNAKEAVKYQNPKKKRNKFSRPLGIAPSLMAPAPLPKIARNINNNPSNSNLICCFLFFVPCFFFFLFLAISSPLKRLIHHHDDKNPLPKIGWQGSCLTHFYLLNEFHNYRNHLCGYSYK